MRVQIQIAHRLRERVPLHPAERQKQVRAREFGVPTPPSFVDRAVDHTLGGFANPVVRDVQVVHVRRLRAALDGVPEQWLGKWRARTTPAEDRGISLKFRWFFRYPSPEVGVPTVRQGLNGRLRQFRRHPIMGACGALGTAMALTVGICAGAAAQTPQPSRSTSTRSNARSARPADPPPATRPPAPAPAQGAPRSACPRSSGSTAGRAAASADRAVAGVAYLSGGAVPDDLRCRPDRSTCCSAPPRRSPKSSPTTRTSSRKAENWCSVNRPPTHLGRRPVP